MTNFFVRIIEYDENTHIYTEATKINTNDEQILVDYNDGDDSAIHQLNRADEIIIKANR